MFGWSKNGWDGQTCYAVIDFAAIEIMVERSKLVLVLDSLVFYDLFQITDLPNLIYFANFYKTQEIFSHICFIDFGLAYISSILLYQFVNLLKRFGGPIIHPNILLYQINSIGFANSFAIYAMYPGPSACQINK